LTDASSACDIPEVITICRSPTPDTELSVIPKTPVADVSIIPVPLIEPVLTDRLSAVCTIVL